MLFQSIMHLQLLQPVPVLAVLELGRIVIEGAVLFVLLSSREEFDEEIV